MAYLKCSVHTYKHTNLFLISNLLYCAYIKKNKNSYKRQYKKVGKFLKLEEAFHQGANMSKPLNFRTDSQGKTLGSGSGSRKKKIEAAMQHALGAKDCLGFSHKRSQIARAKNESKNDLFWFHIFIEERNIIRQGNTQGVKLPPEFSTNNDDRQNKLRWRNFDFYRRVPVIKV